MKEEFIINNYLKKLSKKNPYSLNLNDDVFFDKNKKLVISVDTYNEGIHFLNFKEEHKAPIFEDPLKGLKSIINRTALNKDLSSSLRYIPEVEEGDIIIFPSYLQHTVPAGKYNSHRVTIALNLNVQLT